MKCRINNEIVDVKVVENLGFQGGKHAKVVTYQGKEFVVVKDGGIWNQHKPTLKSGSGYIGQRI
jgi:hypothetical protein